MLMPGDLFGNVQYQPFTVGAVCGIVRVAPSADPEILAGYGPEDIVVVPEVPDDIQVVGALVTQEVQTPLCHVALLCANRKTPNLLLRGERLESLTQYHGRAVFLNVTGQEFYVDPIADVQAAMLVSWWQQRVACHAGTPTPPLPSTINGTTDLLSLATVSEMVQTHGLQHAVGCSRLRMLT